MDIEQQSLDNIAIGTDQVILSVFEGLNSLEKLSRTVKKGTSTSGRSL